MYKLIISFIDLNCTLTPFVPACQARAYEFHSSHPQTKGTCTCPIEMHVACRRTLALSCYVYMFIKDLGQESNLASDWYWIGHRLFNDTVINCKNFEFHNITGC
jgi:hypothetical protein